MYGSNMIKTGKFVVAATPAAVTVDAGFKPSYVKAIVVQTGASGAFRRAVEIFRDGTTTVASANHADTQFAAALANGITFSGNSVIFGTGVGANATDVVNYLIVR